MEDVEDEELSNIPCQGRVIQCDMSKEGSRTHGPSVRGMTVKTAIITMISLSARLNDVSVASGSFTVGAKSSSGIMSWNILLGKMIAGVIGSLIMFGYLRQRGILSSFTILSYIRYDDNDSQPGNKRPALHRESFWIIQLALLSCNPTVPRQEMPPS